MERLPVERQHYVTDNLNLVHFILHKVFHMETYYDSYEDYFQEGCIGLILSAIRFDESKGYQFSTYATPMIRGSIMRFKRDKESPVRIPRNKYSMTMNIIALSSQGHTMKDIELITGFSGKEICKAISILGISSLDNSIVSDSEGKNMELYEVIPDDSNSYEELLSEENIVKSINKVIKSFKRELHKDIWEEYIWSIYYGEKLINMYFAQKYNISQSQVNKILRAGNTLLSKYLVNSK